MIKISVVVPYYNESETILVTLESLKNQTLKPSEVVLVNSSSTDKTFSIINTWIKKNKLTNFFNIDSSSKTPSTSKNIGIEKARYDWLAFMDCDQFFQNDWLEKQVSYLLNSKELLIVSGVCKLRGKSYFDRACVAQTYGIGTNRVCIPGSLIHRSIFSATGKFIENMRSAYDRSWQQKVSELNIRRFIPNENNISYFGVNFCADPFSLVRKIYAYSLPSIRLKSYNVPKYYFLYLIFSIAIFNLGLMYGLINLFLYILIRGFFIPFYKSRERDRLINFRYIILLPLVGSLIDLSRLSAYFFGYLMVSKEKE